MSNDRDKRNAAIETIKEALKALPSDDLIPSTYRIRDEITNRLLKFRGVKLLKPVTMTLSPHGETKEYEVFFIDQSEEFGNMYFRDENENMITYCSENTQSSVVLSRMLRAFECQTK